MSVLLREAIGDSIRRARTERRRTLRDVSHAARVSLGYLSEVERGRKEPSSELLASICAALAMTLPDLLDDAADVLRPAGSRRGRAGVEAVDPVLRSAVEEAFGPVTDAAPDASPTATTGGPATGSAGAGPAATGLAGAGEARASATDPTLPPDAPAGADDDLDGALDGLAVGDRDDAPPSPGTVTLIARLPLSGPVDTPARLAA